MSGLLAGLSVVAAIIGLVSAVKGKKMLTGNKIQEAYRTQCLSAMAWIAAYALIIFSMLV